MDEQIVLGDRVQDTVSGLTGIVVAKCTYLAGSDQMMVQPEHEQGKPYIEAQWFDTARLVKL